MPLRSALLSAAMLLGLLVLARWVWTLLGGEAPAAPLGYFSWAAYALAGLLALSLLASGAVGIHHLLTRASRAAAREGAAAQRSTAATYFYVDAAGGAGPYALATIRLVPALALADVTFREHDAGAPGEDGRAMRTLVNDALARMRRESAPDAWPQALPAALAGLAAHACVLRGPAAGVHWYDATDTTRRPD